MSSTPPSIRSRYATTSDGISIAYVRTGDGYPLVYLAGFGHVVREWNIPEQRAWYAGIAAERSLVRLDIRNFGLSERNAPRITVETCIADVEAVVEHLGLERFDLMAVGGWTPAAIGFAASHQKSVSKLVLWSAGATIADWHGPGDAAESPHDRVDALLEAEPEIQLGLLRLGMFAGSTVPPGEQREYIRAMATPEGLALYNRYLREADVRDAVARVQCPTLIIYPGRVDWPIDGSRRIASSMANAELVDIDAEGSPFQGGDSEPALNLINEFLGVNAGGRSHSRDGERADGPLAGLTRRELEILSLIARGETNQGIASSLTLSPSTVARHTANIYMKLDIHNRAQATARYLGRA